MLQPIAERRLTYHSERENRDVLVRIWAPIEYDATFFCDFAIDGLPDPVRSSTAGIDAVQALWLAFSSLRSHLKPHRASLSFLNERGEHGFSIVPTAPSNELLRRLEGVVESEQLRLLDEALTPLHARVERAGKKADPDFSFDNIETSSSSALIEHLRSAIARRHESEIREAYDATIYFTEKLRRVLTELRVRDEYDSAMKAFLVDSNRAIRFFGARCMAPSSDAKRALEALTDEGIEPEASEAEAFLKHRRDDEMRPRGWGE